MLEAEAKAVAPRWGLMMLLALVCFVPRAWIACHWDLVWTDSVTYLHAAEALERGDLHAAFEETGLNVYPVILCGLRRLGMDWTAAGTWWSVLMATAAVLPLFGWVRRQFDDQVASAACLAYAFHGKLMAVSVLIIRDPTFWFLFNLTLYLLWRARHRSPLAAVSRRGTVADPGRAHPERGLAAGGPAAALAGIPVGRRLQARRWKLAGGTALCLAMVPLCTALVNLTWLRDAPRWSPIREAHVQILRGWLGLDTGQAGRPARVPRRLLRRPPTPAAGGDQVSMALETDPMGFSPESLSKSLRKFGETLVKSYTYLLGLLALIGIWRWWRVYLRRDHQTLLLMVLVLLAMIWVRNTQVRSDIRYFFPMVLVSFPWIGLGFLKLSDWGCPARLLGPRRDAPAALGDGARLGGRRRGVRRRANTNLASARFMREHAELGKWIRGHFGPDRTIVGNIHETRLVQYYSQGRIVGYLDPRACEGAGLAAGDPRRPAGYPPALDRSGKPRLLGALRGNHPRRQGAWAIGSSPADQLPAGARPDPGPGPRPAGRSRIARVRH